MLYDLVVSVARKERNEVFYQVVYEYSTDSLPEVMKEFINSTEKFSSAHVVLNSNKGVVHEAWT